MLNRESAMEETESPIRAPSPLHREDFTCCGAPFLNDEKDFSLLLKEPLAVLMERYHWSEVETLRQLRDMARRLLFVSTDAQTEEECARQQRASMMESRDTDCSPSKEFPAGVQANGNSLAKSPAVMSSACSSLLSRISTPVWDLTRKNTAMASLTTSFSSSVVLPPISTGFPVLDATLLGGLRPQFLTEFISPRCITEVSSQSRSTAYGGASPRAANNSLRSSHVCCPHFSSHSPFFSPPNRVLLAQIALHILRSNPAAMVWWLHPSPAKDYSLYDLCQPLSDSLDGSDSTASPSLENEKGTWKDRLLFSPIPSFRALLEWTRTFSTGDGASLPTSLFSSLSTSTSSSSPRIQLIVIEELTLLVQRSCGDATVVSSPSFELIAQLQTFVEQWKNIAFKHGIAVVFLNTSNISSSSLLTEKPRSLHSRDNTSTATVFATTEFPFHLSVEGSHELGRGFSHAMNIRFCLYPGWVVIANEERLNGSRESSKGSRGSLEDIVSLSNDSCEEDCTFFQLKVLKSPLTPSVLLSFRVKPLTPHGQRLYEVENEWSERSNKVGQKRKRTWLPFPLLSAVDPLDCILAS